MANQVPEDELAERDAEERRAGRGALTRLEPEDEIPEEVLAELDADARLAEETLVQPTDERVVEIEEQA
jgi:hypothetical protein